MVTAARSRNIRFTFIIQNFAQLYEVYGKENGETIKGNCGNIVYLISTELSALEEISKMCGEVKSKEKEKTSSTPLVTVSDLQRMQQWETIILRIRTMPFKTKLTPNFKMNWGHNFPKANYPQRQEIPVQIFDLKSYVEKKREEKLNNLLGGAGMPGAPAGGGMFGAPAGGGAFGAPVGGGMNNVPPVPFGNGTPANPFSSTGLPPVPMSNGMNADNKPTPPRNGGINVEDLVKRIDAKIAELEEEEKKEKEKEVKAETPSAPSASVDSGASVVPTPTPQSQPVVMPSIPEASSVPPVTQSSITPAVEQQNQDTVSTASSTSGISDDQFFDDFFGDD